MNKGKKLEGKKFDAAGDNLVYVVAALPGGVDGMDMTSRGGPVYAFATREEAERKVGCDTRYEIRTQAVNGPELRRRLAKKLTVVERYFLEQMGVKL